MLYDIGFLIFSLFYLPTLIFKGKLHKDFGERFGIFSADKRRALQSLKDTIWIEAVSVGEVALLRPFVPLLKERFPGSSIVISTITKTGNDLAKKLYSNDATVIYFPLDLSFIVKRVIGSINPAIYVMVETEIWPGVLRQVHHRSVPAILINGRISDRSFGRYMLARKFLRSSLGRIAKFCMQSRLDAERIIVMGAHPDKVVVTGNMKLDIKYGPAAPDKKDILASLGLGEDAELIVAGSTHPGEEEIALEAYKELAKARPNLTLLIAPRHIERSAGLEKLARSYGLRPIRVSKTALAKVQAGAGDVIILDVIGRLGDIYSAAAAVFVGGSLVRHGGQNPVEPAMAGKPVIFGPHMFNFKSVSSMLLEAGGAIQVEDKDGLLQKLSLVLRDGRLALDLGKKAKEAIEVNSGASARCAEEMAELFTGA